MPAADEAVVGGESADTKDALLGAGNGWLETTGQCTAAQMVSTGHGTGCAQRDRHGYAHTQHSHTHVRVLP